VKKNKKAIVIGVSAVGFCAFAFWAWHGLVSSTARWFMASASVKLFLLLLILAVAAFAAATVMSLRKEKLRYPTNEEARKDFDKARKSYRAYMTLGVTASILGVLVALVLPPFGGYYRSTVLADSVSTTDAPQATYEWRIPWTVAAASVTSRAGNVIGDFATGDTTYLPGLGVYSTPVQARGFAAGLSTAVIQSPSSSTASVCTFTSEAPVSSGMFAANLKRAISFVDPGLDFTASDTWVYCDGKNAKLVVPVIRMAGQPESYPVPAGVIIYDGANATLKSEVKAGELPGPVYPSSLAADQRSSLEASQGFWDKVMSRAGYETSEDTDGDPNSGNVSEILLKRAGGWDYVTPLTPRGKSFTVTAVAVVPADHVKAGEFNKLVVHKLTQPREGNQALADRVKAAFPQLGWAAGLQLVEVIPTSPTTWDATLSNGRAVANRVSVTADGTLCLQDTKGKTINCVTQDGAAQAPSNTTGAGEPTGSPVAPNAELGTLTDAELAQLLADAAQEQLRRVNARQ
jgi:hypothetical protein